MATKRKYKMKIVRSTVDKLGVKLYDKVSAVLAELIANSYDADAKKVTIELPLDVWLAKRESDGKYIDKEGRKRTKWIEYDNDYKIIVNDDGCGMTPDELQGFYLNVGLDRRIDAKRGDVSPIFKRKVMGRKGVGKLAPFGICENLEIISAGGEKTAKGYLTSHIIMNYKEMNDETDLDYEPETGVLDGMFQQEKGTKIILSKFGYRHIPNKENLNRQIARRFGLETNNWKIIIKDTLSNNTFTIGQFDTMNEKMEGTYIDLNGRYILIDELEFPVSGWVAYSKEPYKDEEMAGIRIYSRNKLFATTRDFGLKAGFTGEHTIRSYLFGALYIDWLDDEEDVSKTDRQDILWDSSEKCIALRDFGQKIIKELGNRPVESIRKKVWEKFKTNSNIENIIESKYKDNSEFKKQILEAARIFANKISLDEVDNEESIKQVEDLALLIGPHKVLVDKLSQIAESKDNPLSTIVELFEISRFAEIASLGQIADKRVQAIYKLKESIDEATDEITFQQLLEEAPWLINFEWTPLTMNQSLNTARSSFESWYNDKYKTKITTSAIKHKSKRPDFVMLGFSSTIYIVEIKRTKHKLTDVEFDRFFKYYKSLETFLNDHPVIKGDFSNGVKTILVCDGLNISEKTTDHFDRLVKDKKLEHLKWREFLAKTQKAHKEFLRINE